MSGPRPGASRLPSVAGRPFGHWLVAACLLLSTSASAAPPKQTGGKPDQPAKKARQPEATKPRPIPYDEQPYRIRALISFSQDPKLTSRLRRDVLRRFRAYAVAFVGDAWRVQVDDVSNSLAASSFERIAAMSAERLKPWVQGQDKLFVMGVEFGGDRYTLAAREYDVTFHWWGPAVQRSVRDRSQVARQLVVMAAGLFAPLARLESGDNRRIRILVKGGRLPCLNALRSANPRYEPSFEFISTGDLFRPMYRKTQEDEDGNIVTLGISPLPWTFYRLEKYRNGKGRCVVYSARRSPLPPRSYDPNESQMIAVRTAGGSTELRLVSRVDRTPLAAIDVEMRESFDAAAIPLGTTDLDGRIRIPPTRNGTQLVIVFVRHGGTTLARLPIVPGAGPEPELALRPDPIRLEIEGYVLPVQEEIIDQVARRKIIETRIRTAIKKKDWANAERLLKALKNSPTKEQMQAKLDLARKEADALRGEGVPQTPKVRRMFAETQQAIDVFFNPDDFQDLIEELEDLLTNEREEAQAAAAAKRANATPPAKSPPGA